MSELPVFLPVGFGCIVLITIFMLAHAANFHKGFLIGLLAWTIGQSVLSIKGFYTHYSGLPPRMLLLVAPPVIALITTLLTRNGRAFLDRFNLQTLTLLHTVRIPVE